MADSLAPRSLGTLDVVIVHYGAPGATVELARALARNSHVRVTVVDNSGNLDPPAAPHARILTPRQNLGFGRAVNLGAGETDGDWLLLLNPDVKVSAATIGRLLQAAQGDRAWGVLSPELEYPDGRRQITGGNYSGWAREISRALRAGKLVRPARAALAHRRRRATNGLHPRPWVSGAAMLVRRSAFEQIGGFDERFFMYYEDEDLCRRAVRAGWTVGVLIGATASHAVGGTSRLADPYSSPAFEDSRVLYHQFHSSTLLQAFVRWDSRRARRTQKRGGNVVATHRV